MLRVIQVNRFNCGAENNAGTLQREAEMLRERQAVILSYVNFQKLFPVIVSIVDCGVIVLLLAADKPLEEFWSPLDSIRTPSDRKLWLNRAASSFFCFFLVAVVFPLCLCTNMMTQPVKRRQTQQTETDINTSVSSYVHAAR